MRLLKLIPIIFFLTVAGGVFHSHQTGDLFPAIPASFLIIGVGGAILTFKVETQSAAIRYIFVILVSSLILRWYIYAFPASYIGFDPDRYADWAEIIIQTGAISELPRSFYREAPAGLLLPAMTSIVTGIHIKSGFGIYSILLAILIPLLAVAFGSRIYQPSPSFILGTFTLGCLLATSIKRGYWPLPQDLAILLLQVFLLLFIVYMYSDTMNIIPIVICLITLSYAHKIPLFLASGIVITAIFLKYPQNKIQLFYLSINSLKYNNKSVLAFASTFVVLVWSGISSYFTPITVTIAGLLIGFGTLYILYSEVGEFSNAKKQMNRGLLLPTILILVIFLINWTYQTDWFRSLVLNYYLQDFGGPSTIQGFTSAHRAHHGLLNMFFHQSPILLILLGAAIPILWVAIIRRNHLVSLSAMGLLYLLSPFSIAVKSSVGIGATRLIPNLSALLVSFIGIGLFSIPKRPQAKRIAIVVLVILLVFQSFSAAIIPDYPGTYRAYLHESEVEGKSFTNKYTKGTITTDYWYAEESVDPLPNTYADVDTEYHGETKGYVMGTLITRNHPYILQRTEVTLYRFAAPGSWQLSWDPKVRLDKSYNKVYSNNGVSLYTNSSIIVTNRR